MKMTLVCLSVLFSLSALAETHREDRKDATGKDVPIAVGNCSLSELYRGFDGKDRIRSTFALTTCREFKNYKVDVTTSGKWYDWKADAVTVPGTENLTYEVSQDVKGADEPVNPQDNGQGFRVMNTCDNIREGYVNAKKAGGPPKCTLN